MKFVLVASDLNKEGPQRVTLDALPVIVGRSRDCQLCIPVTSISRNHAKLTLSEGELRVEDLGSTNGTYVNHRRIDSATPLQHLDVVHFANHEFCLRELEDTQALDDDDGKTRIGIATLPNNFPVKAREFIEMVECGRVCGFHQPITFHNGDLYGYELLGRGDHPQLSRNPYDMFKLAADLDMEIELSEILRVRCFEQAAHTGIRQPLFFNSHPKECQDPQRLLTELERLRAIHPELRLVFEIHEAAVTDPHVIREIANGLQTLDIDLAYDDFGAGQARLLELTEVPPSVLKFDIALVSGVGEPDSVKHRMLNSLNKLVQDMGIATLAEGVETSQVADACRDMGINYFQGFYYGRPVAISA